MSDEVRRQVIIMRGLPGSGKSTRIDNLFHYYHEPKGELVNPDAPFKGCVCSADWFHHVNGEYRYDPTKAGEAHKACLKKFATALMTQALDRDVTIIVDNTNTTVKEIAPYYALADALDCDVKILRMVCDFETACHRNVHSVPPSTIWAMHQNLLTERIPAHWKEVFLL